MTTDNEKKLFEEYRMELIYLDGDVITSSGDGNSPETAGDGDPWNSGSGDEGWGEEPGIE